MSSVATPTVEWFVHIEPAKPDDPHWCAYNDEDAAKLERAFQKKSKTMMLNKIYKIDFTTMRQIRREDVDRWRTIKRGGKADEKPPQPDGNSDKPEESSGKISLSMPRETRHFQLDCLLCVHSAAVQKRQQQVEKQTKQLAQVQRMWEAKDYERALAVLMKSVQDYPSTIGIETLKTYLDRLSPSIMTKSTTTHTTTQAIPPANDQSVLKKTSAGDRSTDGSFSESQMRQVQADDNEEVKINIHHISLNPTPSTCAPMARQPLTNLALICRYLTPKELLAIDKTCRLLNQAASHPLTFQHETEVGVEHDLYHCRSYARGPVGVFSGDCTKLQRALTSRLFRHFRSLELRHANELQGKYLSMIVYCEWVKCLTTNLTTPIRALTVQIAPYPHQLLILPLDGKELDFFRSTLIEWKQSPTMRYLTMLHLESDEWMGLLLEYIPTSVKILHLTLPDKNGDCDVKSILDGILTSSSKDRADSLHLEHLILDGCAKVEHVTNCYDLLSLASFSHQANVEVIHWRFPVNLDLLVTGGIMQLLPKLIEHKILHLHTIMIEFEPNRIPNDTQHDMLGIFEIFSDLRSLIFLSEPTLPLSSVQFTPSRILTQLVEEVRIAFKVGEYQYSNDIIRLLIAADLERVHTLVFDDSVNYSLSTLFLTTPHLTSLAVHGFEDVCPTYDVSIVKTLPALIELRLQHIWGATSIILNNFLSELPAFKRIRWGRRGWMIHAEAIKQLQAEEVRQQEGLRLLKEQQEAHRLKERQRIQAQQAAVAQRKQNQQLKQLGSVAKLSLERPSQIDQHLAPTSMPSTTSTTGTTEVATAFPANTVDSPPHPQPILFTKKVIKGKKVRRSTDQLASTSTATSSSSTSINTFTPAAFNFVTPIIGDQAPTTSLTNLTETSFATNAPVVFSPFPSTTTTTV